MKKRSQYKNLKMQDLHNKNHFKDYFNLNFSQPKPATCRECEGHGTITDAVYPGGVNNCEACNGDGIESWICYVYDEEVPFYLDYFNKDRKWRTGEGELKPLQIIVNPFSYIVEIKK